MSTSLDTIQATISQELDLFEVKFREAVKSKTPLLDTIMRYIVKRKGKQIRPMFVFLSAKIASGITDKTYRAASLIELLHTATLVHDDVVDDSYERRGFFSINALWKNKIAVLVGDYLLAKGLLLAVNNEDFDLLKIVSDTVREMSEGELLQIEKTRRLDIKEDIYYEIIRQKTATLISSACACGAASTGTSKEVVNQFKLFGEKVGIAFQIKDDLLDFGSGDIGKPRGIDIKEKKMTLPLIYALNNSSSSDRRQMINIVKNHSKDVNEVAKVLKFVNQSGGIEYAVNKMNEYRSDALKILHSLPANSAAQSMEQLVLFTTERKK